VVTLLSSQNGVLFVRHWLKEFCDPAFFKTGNSAWPIQVEHDSDWVILKNFGGGKQIVTRIVAAEISRRSGCLMEETDVMVISAPPSGGHGKTKDELADAFKDSLKYFLDWNFLNLPRLLEIALQTKLITGIGRFGNQSFWRWFAFTFKLAQKIEAAIRGCRGPPVHLEKWTACLKWN